MCSSEEQASGASSPGSLTPARVSFSRVKLPPYQPRRRAPTRAAPALPNQSPFGKFLSAAEGVFQSFCTKWGPVTTRARDSLLKHATERQLTFLNAAPMRLASLSLSNDQTGEPKAESVRPPSRRKASGLQLGQEVAQEEERVLISEILIQDKDGQLLTDPELNSTAWEALKACKPNFALTTSEVQADVHRIIDTGFFASCMPSAEDTRDGVRLIFKVEPNQELKGLVCNGANVLPTRVVHNAFRDEFGKVVNIQRLNTVLDTLNGWYRDRGLFGQVTDVEILHDGVIKVQVAEAEVHNINIRFLDRKTGEPTVGKTRPETLLRQLTTKKGQVYSLQQGRRDVETVFTMGIMEDVNLVPQPAGDTGMVDLTMNVVERVTGGFSAGGGLSGNGISNGALSGLVGSFAYSHRNAFGRNQKLNVSLERGQVDSMFRINYTDPWIEGDDKRTSRAINIQNSRAPGTTVHGVRKDALSTGPLHGGVTIGRLMAGVDYSRPLRPKWSGTAGISFQRAGARDEHGSVKVVDMYGGPLTFSGRAFDDMLVTKLETVYTDSGDNGSSQLVFNTEQALPVAPDWLFFNRINVRARQGLRLGPVRCIASFSGGTVVGDLAPHEAFPIGGTNSVRGYDEGAVGSGRSCVVASGEISIPLAGPVEGAIFADYGSDLGSGSTVPGDPAGVRGKPGHGYGYGAGLRVDSPLGPLRLEYAFNDSNRLHASSNWECLYCGPMKIETIDMLVPASGKRRECEGCNVNLQILQQNGRFYSGTYLAACIGQLINSQNLCPSGEKDVRCGAGR